MAAIEVITGPSIGVSARHGEIWLEDWAELIGRFPQHSDRAIASALKSEGSRLQRIIKRSILAGGPPGAQWPELQPHTLAIKAAKRRHARWASKRARGGKVRQSTIAKYSGHVEVAPGAIKPLRRMAGQTRYYYDNQTKTVTIGFLSEKSRELAKKHAQGYTRTVDRRMRKMLAAHGFPVREGTTINVPPRPVVEPVFNAEQDNITNNIRVKAIDNIYRYLTGKPKDR